MTASEAGLAVPAFDALPDGLGLAVGVDLAFAGAAGSAGGFDEPAPDGVLPAGADVFPEGLPAGAGEVPFGVGVLEAFEVLGVSEVCGDVLAAGPSEGSLLISPRISFSRSAREIVRPFISLTETSSAGAA